MSLRRAMKKLTSYELGIAQTLVARNINTFRGRVLQPYGLSSPEWFVLGMVDNRTAQGGIRVTDLAATLDVKTTYVTATLNSLKSKGYATTKPDYRDARARLVVATKNGHKAASTIEANLQKAIEKLLQGRVTSEQFESYIFVLREIAQLQD